tara:strand:- start:1128 stop:1274 length:147 start_codon:yes stop_codon:yes gene_type:complete
MKKKEYYREELEKSPEEKLRSIELQKYFTGGAIILMFIILVIMFFVLN